MDRGSANIHYLMIVVRGTLTPEANKLLWWLGN